MMTFYIVVAMDLDSGIGKGGKLPWHLPGDLKHFKDVTTSTSLAEKQNVVVMGRKTWDSIPEKFRPLPGRINVVLTRNTKLVFPAGVLIAASFNAIQDALEQNGLQGKVETVFVIGGEQIFREAISHPQCKKIYITQIEGRYGCDTFFPDYIGSFKLQDKRENVSENGVNYCFSEYTRKS